MDFATYLQIVTEFNPALEELAPLYEILQMRINGQITDEEMQQMLEAYNQQIQHPPVLLSYAQFKQGFLASEKIFYALLDAKFMQLQVTSNFKLAFLSLLSQQCTAPYLTQDNFVKFLLVLSKPSEFTSTAQLIEAAAQLLQACNAVSGCVSAGQFLQFLLEQRLDDRALRALELGCQYLKIRDVLDILKATVQDAKSRELICNAALIRAGAPLDSNLAQKLKYLCKQNKCSPDGINEFLIYLREEYDRALCHADEETVVNVYGTEKASCDIDALILAAEWVPVEVGGRKGEDSDVPSYAESYEVGDDKKVLELQRQLAQMKRGRPKK